MENQWREIENRLRAEMGSHDFETDIVLEEEERRIKRVLAENDITLSEAAFEVVWSYAVWDVHPSRTGGRLSGDEARTALSALGALGLRL